jgi:hypothetical protein
VKRHGQRPVLITDAAHSQDDQLRSRQVRYIVMMAVRAGCLIVGAVLVGANAPLLWLWLPLCGVGMIIVPWLAVLLANDRPPRKRSRRLARVRRDEAPPRSLPTDRPAPTIDVDP